MNPAGRRVAHPRGGSLADATKWEEVVMAKKKPAKKLAPSEGTGAEAKARALTRDDLLDR